MPKTTSQRPSDHVVAGLCDPLAADPPATEQADDAVAAADRVAQRVRGVQAGLTSLLAEADEARRQRAELATGDGGTAVCAWNHFENIPTFYNWNNRPR